MKVKQSRKGYGACYLTDGPLGARAMGRRRREQQEAGCESPPERQARKAEELRSRHRK
ncbi:MAG: hypothetical protein LUO89_16185 [Methanothrix sp.]|nr:hypothetical protein [Methanothrix sp.]